MLCVVPSLPYFLFYGFRASQWPWAQAAVQGQCGWGQNLEFYVPQSTGSLRIIGEILEGCNQLQDIQRTKQFLSTYTIESDPKATLDVCFLLNNLGFITVLKDLTFSHPRFLSALEEALSYCSRNLWWGGEWNNSFLKFSPLLGNFFLWLIHWICSTTFRTIYKENDDKTAFFSLDTMEEITIL